MASISHICREHARRLRQASRERARQLRHEFKHRRPHRLRHRIVILCGAAAVVVGLWLFVQWRAELILQREFGRAMGAGWTLHVGRMGMNPLCGSYSAHDIYIKYAREAGALGGSGGTVHRVGDSKTVRSARKPLDFSLKELVADGLFWHDKELAIKYLSLVKPRVRRGRELHIKIGSAAINRDSIVGVEFARGVLNIARASHLNGDQSVRISIDALRADTTARTLTLAQAAIEPTYPKEEFAQKSWSHSDWTQVVLNDISLDGVDFGELLRGSAARGASGSGGAYPAPLTIETISIGGGSIASYKDRNVLRDEKEKPMYHAIIQQIKPYVQSKKLLFAGLSAVYEELPVRGLEAGRVEFSNINGEAVLTDTAEAIDAAGATDATKAVPTLAKTRYEWRADALVQGAATLTAHGTLPLEDDYFTIEGMLGHCDAAIFNSVSLPLGKIKIMEGALGGLALSMQGDSQRAHTSVGMSYSGLSVAVFSRRNRERRLLTVIANEIMLEKTIPWRTAQAEQVRDPLKSPWNYIWHAIFAAAKEPIGMKNTP